MKFISLRVSPPIQALYTVVWYWIYIVDFEIRFCTILSYISWKGAGPEWNITQCRKKLPHLFCTMHIVYTVSYSYWPTQPGNPLAFRVFTVISFSVFCSTKVVHCIDNGQFFIFKVSKRLYWTVWHDRIFESGAIGSIVAKNWTKILVHFSAIWRAKELKYRI